MQDSNITVTNQLRTTETLDALSEEKIVQFLNEHTFTKGSKMLVTFFNTGVSSLVCKIVTDTKSYVLKIALRTKPIDESIFLLAWEKAGVSVPQTYESGNFSGKKYFFLEYIDSNVLSKHFTPEKLVKENVYFEMGRTLKIMHGPIAQGFGRPEKGTGKYKTFNTWLTTGEDIQDALAYVLKNNLYPLHTNIINKCINTLLQNIGFDSKSSFCHDDYTIENIFATQPLTVFDPNPKYNNGLIDLGRSIASIIGYGYEQTLEEQAIKQMVDGYFLNEESNQETLIAVIILGIIWKSPYPHRTGNLEILKIFNKYLNRTI